MWLWNALMPVIFSLPLITFWQAVGLTLLGKLLFGGFGHGNDKSKRPKDRPHINPFNGFNRSSWNDCEDEDWHRFQQFWKTEGRDKFKHYQENSMNENNSDKE